MPDSLGGIEKAIETICKSTSNAGVENTVIALSKKPSFRLSKKNYSVEILTELFEIFSTPVSFKIFKRFFLKMKEADLVHFHYPYPLSIFLSFICINKPYIITYHSDIVKQRFLARLIYPLDYIFLKRAQQIIATSSNYFKTSDYLKLFENKVSVIPLGLNLKDMEFSLDESSAIEPFDGEPFFLFLGSNRYYKGLHILLDGLEKHPEIKVVISGESDKELKKIAEQKKMHNVIFTGEVDERQKFNLLRKCFGFVFPSHLRSEAFGLALLEASFFGKPLVSCEIGTGTSHVNINEQTGYVVEPSSSKKLMEALIKLQNKPELARKFGENAANRARELFTAEKQGKSYVNLYKKILAIR